MNNNNNDLNLSQLVYKDRIENQQQSFTIRESNLERDDIFKLGKSLFILLNDASSSVVSKQESISSNSSSDTDLLFSNNSDNKKALNSIEKSIEINPIDSMNSIIDTMVSKYNEIQMVNEWKFDLSFVILNIYSSIERYFKQQDIATLNSNSNSNSDNESSIIIKKLSNPPQHYFKIFRLFSYILNNSSSRIIFYKSVYNNLTDKIIDINSNNESDNNKNNNNTENNNSSNSIGNNIDNSEILDKRKVKEEFNKEEKKQILDLFSFIQHFYMIYSFNNIKNTRLHYEELLLIINEILPAIINGVLNKCNIINKDTGLSSPTRLTTQSSDILISFVIIAIINLQIKFNSLKDEENEEQNKQLLKSLNTNLIEYLNEIKKWYHNKPLFIDIIDIIGETLSNEFSNILDNLVFIYQIIPLFYYQYPLNIKISLLNNNIQSLLKISSQSTFKQIQIQSYTISIIQLLSNISEKSLNSFIQENHNIFTNILLFLLNIKDDNNCGGNKILKTCSSKLLEIVYKINLNSDIDSDDNYCIELIKKENLIEKPALLDFAIVLIKNSPQLIKLLINVLNNNSSNNNKDNRIVNNNIVIILDALYKDSPNLLPTSAKDDILNTLLPSPSSFTISSSSPSFLLPYECLSVLLNNFEPSVILPRILQYLFINNTIISSEFLDNFAKWILDSVQIELSSVSTLKEQSLDFKFEILLEIILDNYSKLPTNASKSYSNPADLYSIEDDDEEVSENLNENKQNYNYEILVDKVIPLLGKKLSQVKDNQSRFNYWKVIIGILEIKSFSNPKNSVISKILPKLIKFIDKEYIIRIIISSVNEKLKIQNSILLSTETSKDSEEIFKFLSPLLILTVSIKEVVSEMFHFSRQSTENDILIAELVDNLIKRINSTNLLLEIRRLASDCCSYTPPNYWSNSMSNSLSKQYQNYSNIQDDYNNNNNNNNNNSELIKSSQIMKLLLFCFCNGYLVHGSNDINDDSNGSGIPFKNSKELLELFDLILFKYSDTSKELINASPDSEIGKLFMAVGDCVSFMIKSQIKRASSTIASNSTISLNMEKLKNHQSINLLNKINSMNDLIPTIFRIILFTNSIQKQSRSITNLTASNSTIDYYYSKRSKIVLLNSFITLIKLLDYNENEYLSKHITLLLIKINYLDGNIIDFRLKIGSIQVLFNLYFKLEEDSESLKLYSESLLDLIKEILDCTSSSSSSPPQIKLASLRLLGVLMKYPKSIFSNQSNLKEITYILTLLSTDSDKEIKSLSLNLLNLLKAK